MHVLKHVKKEPQHIFQNIAVHALWFRIKIISTKCAK